MAFSTFAALLLLAVIPQAHCLTVAQDDEDGPNMIAVSPDHLHSCIQGKKKFFEAGSSWTKNSATVIKEGTCEEYWGLAEEIPMMAFAATNPTPFCTDLKNYGAFGMRECWKNSEEVQAHIK